MKIIASKIRPCPFVRILSTFCRYRPAVFCPVRTEANPCIPTQQQHQRREPRYVWYRWCKPLLLHNIIVDDIRNSWHGWTRDVLYNVSVEKSNPTLVDIRRMLRNVGAKYRIPSVVTTRAT